MRTAVIYGSTGRGKQVFSIVQDKYDILFLLMKIQKESEGKIEKKGY